MPRPANHTALPATAQEYTNLWESEIVPLLPADLDEQASLLGALKRRRAIACASDLVRALLAFVLITHSLRHLGAWAVLENLANISHAAWYKRLILSSALLLWLLDYLLAPPQPTQRRFPKVTGSILLVDATVLAQQGGTGDDWRLHTAYDLALGRLVQITVTDRKSGEHPGSLSPATRRYRGC